MRTALRVHASPAYDLLVAMDAVAHKKWSTQHGDGFAWLAERLRSCHPQLITDIETIAPSSVSMAFSALVPQLGEELGAPTIAAFLAGLTGLSAARFLRTLLTLHTTEPSAPVGDDDLLALIGNPAAALEFLDRYTTARPEEERYRRLVMEAVIDPVGTCARLAATMEAFYHAVIEPMEAELAERQQEGARQLAAMLARDGRALLAALTATDPNQPGFSAVVLAPTALGGTHTYRYIHETETPLDERTVQDALLGVAEPWVYEPYIILVGLDWIERQAALLSSAQADEEPWSAATAAATFSLLGDASRLAVIRKLRERPYYVQELARELQISPATAHHHLGTLCSAGLVEIRRASHRVYYFLLTEQLRERLRQGGAFL